MDEKKPPEGVEDAGMRQSYPSPMVDSTEAHYYAQLSQHNRDLDHQPAQPEHHGLPNLQAHEEQQHDHHELHQLQELQDSHSPEQHSSRPQVSADELQLAAQLTQGLAPMMAAAAVQDQTQNQQSMARPEAQMQQQHQQRQSEIEPNLQQQLEASLQNHERDLQDHSHPLQTHGLPDVLSHSEQAEGHHYAQESPAPPHLAHHMSMDHLQPALHPTYQASSEATPPRKRSKVSRACDECRRKKIKCDAESELSEQPCTNCRRSNAQCLFSRVPQKRGPSKGYIKELADRINTIEGKLNTNVSVDGLERRESSDVFASPGLGDDSRKRPFSSISGNGDVQAPSPSSREQQAFATEHRPLLPYVPPDFRPPNAGSASDLTPKLLGPSVHFPEQSNDIHLQDQAEMMDGMQQNGLSQASAHQADQTPEIEDAAFNRYLEIVHPTFPLLASSKARVQSLLWQAPLTLQRAFCNAFFAMLKPFAPDTGSQMEGDNIATAWRLLGEWEAGHRQGSAVTDLVRLQTLVMVAIAVDCQGIASAKGQLGGPSKAEILGRAAGLGYAMRLYGRQIDPEPNPELDPNSDDNVALRAWWVLVMLDRWNAAGTATPPLISNNSVEIPPGLKHIVGEVVFFLIQISHVLGHILPLITHPSLDPLSPTTAYISSMADVTADMLRWVFPDAGRHTDPVLHLAYWHVRMLAELLTPPPRRAVRLLQFTRNSVALLAGNAGLVTPVTFHFVALAAVGLLELGRVTGGGTGGEGGVEEVREEVARLVGDVLTFAVAPSPWNGAVREKLAEYQVQYQVAARPGPGAGLGSTAGGATGQNLQRLADVAAGAVGGVGVASDQVPAAGESGVATVTQLGEQRNGNAVGGGGVGDVAGGAAARDPVDVQAVLRAGYLTWFEEPVAGGLGQ